MAHQDSLDRAYMDIASRWGELSRANRKQVGALIVKDGQIISDGFNGTPAGFDNTCEDESNTTLPEVLHAESNALTKLCRSSQSSEGSTLYVTVSPCFECAKLIVQAGIQRVVCGEEYRLNKGISFLRECGVIVVVLNSTLKSSDKLFQ